METVHNAIAWYQMKIGSYDKQLWEESVEKKLLKVPPNVKNAPKKSVRLKTEYIDVDLIRGSTFTKTKPQVPWIYITRKALVRVIFFPFYYKWWVLQTSFKLYLLLSTLYGLQLISVIVYLRNLDHSIVEDEVSFTEVTLPVILMYLLCLVHSQTVLAHIGHKPPKRTKPITRVVRQEKTKQKTRKGHRSSGNNSSACQDDGIVGGTQSSHSTKGEGRRKSSYVQIKKKEREEAEEEKSDKDGTLSLPGVSEISSGSSKTEVSSLNSKTEKGRGVVRSGGSVKQKVASVSGSRDKSSIRLMRFERISSDGFDTSKIQNELLNSREEESSVKERVVEKREHLDLNSRDSGCICSKGIVNCSNHVVLGNNGCVNSGSFKTHNYCPCCCSSSSSSGGRSHSGINGAVYNRAKIEVDNVDGCDVPSENKKRQISKDGMYSDVLKTNDDVVVDSGIHSPVSSSCLCGSSVHHHNGNTDLTVTEAPSGKTSTCNTLGEISDLLSSTSQDVNIPHSPGVMMTPTTTTTTPHSNTSCHHNFCDAQIPLCQAVSESNDDVGDSATISTTTKASLTVSTKTNGQRLPHDCQKCSNSNPTLLPNSEVSSCQSKVVNGYDCDYSPIHHSYQCSDCQRNISVHSHSLLQKHPTALCKNTEDNVINPPVQINGGKYNGSPVYTSPPMSASHGIQNFSEQFVQEILNADTLREVSSTLLLANSDLESSSSSFKSPMLTVSLSSLSSFSNVASLSLGSADSSTTATESLSPSTFANNSSSASTATAIDLTTPNTPTNLSAEARHTVTATTTDTTSSPSTTSLETNLPKRRQFAGSRLPIKNIANDIKPSQDKTSAGSTFNRSLDESMEMIGPSDAERTSDVSNYSPSESEPDSDAAGLEDLRNRCEEKRKRLRFQDFNNSPGTNGSVSLSLHNSLSGSIKSEVTPSKTSGNPCGANVSRSMVTALTRKPSPLKDLSLTRKPNGTELVSTHSSASDAGQSESTTRSCLRRRRRPSGNVGGDAENSRTRNLSAPLSIQTQENKKVISSSENEAADRYTRSVNKGAMSSEEWEDRIPLDESTSSNYSTSCDNSESEESNEQDGEEMEEEEKTEYTTSTLHVINLLQPQSGSPSSSGNVGQPDKVSCLIWEMNECKKVDLTALDIGWAIIDKVDSLPESSDYFLIGLLFSFMMGMVPLAFRAFANTSWSSLENLLSWSGLVSRTLHISQWLLQYTWRQNLLMFNGILQRFVLSLLFFFLLSVADRTFKQRLLYAKHFSYLTSSRRARKFSMPHFRLNKVRNIKIWLSLRSYLKRRGPQRSVDVIVSASFMCGISTVCLISLQMLKDSGNYLDFLCNWELLVWCLALAVFLLRFMTLGLKINKKYRNLSVLITEQINLYLQMEQKPHKKEELVLANNVLRLAEDLLKELESPFKISGFSANPFIYNITKVIVLSAFSAVLTELLGFKLKLHKIKLKG